MNVQLYIIVSESKAYIAPPYFAVFCINIQFVALPQSIAPPYHVMVWFVNILLNALPWYIAPPLSAVLLVNVE